MIDNDYQRRTAWAPRLAGKTALVTGATSNIGRAIATTFAAEGAHVAAAGRRQHRGAEVIAEIRAAGGRADFLAAVLDGSAQASQDLAQQAARVLGGRIDVLVNSAGIYPARPTAATSETDFDEVYAVNVKALFFLVAAIAPAMANRGSGAIVNLGSWIARLGIPAAPLYSSTKGVIETLTRAWAAEFSLAAVNAISPRVIRNPSPAETHSADRLAAPMIDKPASGLRLRCVRGAGWLPLKPWGAECLCGVRACGDEVWPKRGEGH